MIHLDKVSFQYLDNQAPALQDVDLDIALGTITVVVGASGSGKSTLCYLLMGAIPQTIPGELMGNISIAGLDPRRDPIYEIAQKVGLVFQDPEVMFTNLFVWDEIAFGPANLGWPKAEIEAQVLEVMNYVALQGLEEKPVWSLSGGQAQRLGIACILAMKSDVIIFDEPTANLDPANSLLVYEVIQRLKAQGKAVVIVTKELDELLSMVDQLVVLDHGCIAYAGPPRQLLNQHGPSIRRMGIWLPQVVEIGLQLRQYLEQPDLPLPLSLDEAINLLAEYPSEPYQNQVPDDLNHPVEAPIVIQARNVSYGYPEESGGTQAVKDVSFHICQGELVALLGRNGAGKSTLAKLMMGLLKPNSGELLIAGVDVSRSTPQALAHQIGFVFQDPEHQFVTDSVYTEVAYGLIANRTQEPELSQRVEAMLRLMDLWDLRSHHPFALPAGKKRRLGVATMLVGNPRILVVDEPTYGQDQRMTESLMEIMLQLQRSGTVIIMITHDMHLVESYIPRSIVMGNGQILFDGSTADLFLETELLQRASLRVTPLHRLIEHFSRLGKPIPRILARTSLIPASEMPTNRGWPSNEVNRGL